MDIFQKIRANRMAALALAKQRRETEFSPFRSMDITHVQYVPRAAERGDLTMTLGDGQQVLLPNFYDRHAKRMIELSGQDRLEFLRDVWLNYNAWRLHDRYDEPKN